MELKNRFRKILKNRKLILTHAFVWMVFITYEISFVYVVNDVTSSIKEYALRYALNISLFYVGAWCFRYSFIRRKKPYIYILLILAQLVTYIAIQISISVLLKKMLVPIPPIILRKAIFATIFRALYINGFSVGYSLWLMAIRSTKLISKIQNRRLMQQKRNAELERNLIKTENAYLTAQINPHLLFNTLNFIYSNLSQVSEKAADTVLLLSDMMRYSLTEIGDDGKVELAQEVEHINNMIQLNQARFNDKLQINVNLEGDFNVRIIPLILLTFIENIFKHGDLRDPASPAEVNITYANNKLTYYSRNKVRKVRSLHSTGIGIENSKTRLESAYAGRYSLTSKNDDDQYTTELTINFA